MKGVIAKADALVQDVDSYQVLGYLGRRDTVVQGIKAAKERLQAKMNGDAIDCFLSYRPEAGRDFFADYPLEIEPKGFLKQNKSRWMESVVAGYCEGIKVFSDAYSRWVPYKDFEDVGEIYFKKALKPGNGRKATLVQVADAWKKTRDAGFPLPPLKEPAIRVTQIDNASNMVEEGMEFPIEIKTDLPLSVEKANLDEAFAGLSTDTTDIFVVLSATKARNERKIGTPENVTSKYVAATQTVPNPDYQMVEAIVRQAEFNLQNVRQVANYNAATCQGTGCVFVAINNKKALNSAQENLQLALTALKATPMTKKEPVYATYEFRKATIEATKTTTVNYYVVDKVAQSYIKGTTSVQESRSFNVAYGLREEDPDYKRYSARLAKEDHVVDFEKTPVTVQLSKIIANVAAQQPKPMLTLASLRDEVSTDRRKIATAIKARTYTATPQKDPRFDSVVVVLNPDGSFGSGFFVSDDMVLTNYHVVENGKFVEMKMYNGSETFGKVVAHDVRLDLALIKVQARGVPVKLYTERNLSIGATVEAIGHPKGEEFSITRGVVSGIREKEGINMPGGRKVRFIQTDTAISPGNSGGPLFLGDKVVGVNDWKNVEQDVSGLNFAIHYGEVIDFLEANGFQAGK